MLMKLKVIIEGGKVHEVGYRFFLFTRALELGCNGFYAKNEIVGNSKLVMAFIEGDENQLIEFKNFVRNTKPESADVKAIAFEDYSGSIMSLDAFMHYFTADQLNKGIPAILRIDKKQDKMLEKQDIMIEKQDKMLEKQDIMIEKQDKMLEKQDITIEKQDKMLEKQDITIATLITSRADIVQEIKISRGEITAKLDENREAIIAEIGERKETLDERLRRIESDISKINAKVGL
jgi:acylphosphatase